MNLTPAERQVVIERAEGAIAALGVFVQTMRAEPLDLDAARRAWNEAAEIGARCQRIFLGGRPPTPPVCGDPDCDGVHEVSAIPIGDLPPELRAMLLRFFGG